MNIQEIYELGIAQGWDEDDAYYLARIAWSENKEGPGKITDEPHDTKSYGIWQIHDVHIPKLIEAGIITSVEDLLDPTTNAEAAYYVGHHLDKTPGTELPEEFKDKWDWSRWSVTELPTDDGNHPDMYGADIVRVDAADESGDFSRPPTWDEPDYVVPEDFKKAISQSDSWFERITDWGLDGDQEDLLMSFMHNRFVNGFGPDEENPTGWDPRMTSNHFSPLELFMGEDGDAATTGIYDSVQSFFDGAAEPDYTPGQGALPEGWMTFWGEDYKDSTGKQVIGDWLDIWVERFNKNAAATGGPGDPKYDETELISDFYNHAEDGLYSQGWWTDKTNNFLAMTEMWYTQGGPGGADGSGAVMPGVGGADWTGYAGTGNWGKIWSDSIEVIKSTAEDLGIEDDLTDTMVSQIAFRLMSEGGAAAQLEPQTSQGWANQAQQLVESILVENIQSGTFQNPLGVGSISEIENQIRGHAASQLTAVTPEELRAWALDIKSEKGLNLEQVFATIDNKAYGAFGVTREYMEGLASNAIGATGGGATISDIVAPLHGAATGVWEDSSYTKNDQWLMDNYQEVAEDGTKRFRTAQEMRNLARTNLDRFQHSKQYQTPMNNFLKGAAAMFRSDY
jgi:hypothetical protein